MKTLLLVDDEILILKSLVRLFSDTDYHVLTAESGEQALKLLENEPVDIIISDMRMPEMDGYQLLLKVKELYPNTLRVILSGYADEKLVYKAMQQNCARMYLFKPWNNAELLKVVEHLFETEDLLAATSLLPLINNVTELPTIASSYHRILAMLDSDLSVSQIAHVIEQDHSVATKVLHIANSAFFGVKTGSVKQAVAYLGLQNIKNLVLSTSIVDSMLIKGIGSSFAEGLWRHAFLTNRILMVIYERFLGQKLPESASSAGLLHNIGLVLLLKYYPQDYLLLMDALGKGTLNLLELEKEKFHAPHSDVGGYLLYWWELPFPIVEAALYHHQPFDDRIINKEVVLAVHIAQNYASTSLGNMQYCVFDNTAFEALGIDQQSFETQLSSLELAGEV